MTSYKICDVTSQKQIRGTTLILHHGLPELQQ